MERMHKSRQRITDITHGSPAEKCGVLAGEILLSVNGEPVYDLIDYEYLTSCRKCVLEIEDNIGEKRTVHIVKGETEPLGLSFATSLMSDMRTCANRCVFCFVDQMPKGMRPSLSVKDDDWRLSFIMGNYVTLTNASEREFERILQRKVSPLYISVHATDPEVRVKMMRNRTAGKLLERLQKLAENGIRFHAQVVLCPGLNDGEVLKRTLSDLRSLHPFCGSVAVVPIGLTSYREGLYPLRGFTADEARQIIREMSEYQADCLSQLGTRFAYLSDEWFLMSGITLPEDEAYECYEQIENGVGLLRMFEQDFLYALSEQRPLDEPLSVTIAGGSGSAGFFSELYRKLEPYGIEIHVHPVPNRFFGGNVTVAGLVTGSDLLGEFQNCVPAEPILIPRNMLRETEEVFLDDYTLDEVRDRLGTEIVPFHDGEELVRILFSYRNDAETKNSRPDNGV